jgi:hypothetical protein
MLCQLANFLFPISCFDSSPPSSQLSLQTQSKPSTSSNSSSQVVPTPSDIQAALQITHDLILLARKYGAGHEEIVQLALFLRLRTLVKAEMWYAQPFGLTGRSQDLSGGERSISVQGLLPAVEGALGLSFPEAKPNPPIPIPTSSSGLGGEAGPSSSIPLPTTAPNTTQSPAPTSLALLNLQTHTLVISVLYYTQLGDAKSASARLTFLHKLMDDADPQPQSDGYGDGDLSRSSYLKVSV